MLQKVHHPHAVQFLGAVTTSQPYMLVYEFLPGGSLLDMCAPARARAPSAPWPGRLAGGAHAASSMRPRCNPRARVPAGRPATAARRAARARRAPYAYGAASACQDALLGVSGGQHGGPGGFLR